VVAVGGLLEVLLFLFVSLDPGHQVLEVGRGELPSEGPGGRVVAALEDGESVFDLVKAGEVVRCEDLALDDREVDLHLFNQEAWIGVWTMTAFGNRAVRRSIEAWPRCEEPLSTTQNTRFAEAYGS
jgi:hypothetical protein